MEYSCGRSKNLLKADDFGSEFHDAFFQLGSVAALLRQMYWIFQLIQSLPEWLAVLLSPSLGLILQTRKVWPSQHLGLNFLHKKAINSKAPPYADNRGRDY